MATADPPTGTYAQPPTGPSDGGFTMGNFLSFRYLITPVLVQGIYLIGAALITIGGVVAIVAPGPTSGGALGGLLILLLGNLLWRVYMELVMLFFRINEGVQRIERNTRR